MKKGTRIVKRLLALFLVVLMSINTMGAVVSDNDGSAFITKAEFDSLKNDFQSQIDQYNTSIDSKIDGAIASYLAGIRVEKVNKVDPLVTNYKDINWKNDLYFKINNWTWSGTRSYVESGLKWQRPIFGQYRMLRAGRYYTEAAIFQDIRCYQFFFSFLSNSADGYWLDSPSWCCVQAGTMDQPEWAEAIAPLVFHCYDKENNFPILNSANDVLKQELRMSDRGYPGVAAGGTGDAWDNWTQGNIGPGTDGGIYQAANTQDALMRFTMYFHKYTGNSDSPTPQATKYSAGYYLPKKNNGLGEPGFRDYDTVDVTYLLNTSKTFAGNRYQVKWEDDAQQQNDIEQIKNIFLATSSDIKVNCATMLPYQGPSVYNNYDYVDSELKEIEFYDGSVKAIMNGNNWTQATFKFINASGTQVKPKLNFPIWPQYYMRDLYTKRFQANGKPLQLGGGIPILSNSLSNGNLRIKMLYTVYNADLAVHGTPSQHLHISFKKSSFNDGVTNNYCKDDGGVELKNKLWEPATTLAIPSYEVTIPVKVGDNVWLRLGPKDTNANGLYAKIDNLDVALVTE